MSQCQCGPVMPEWLQLCVWDVHHNWISVIAAFIQHPDSPPTKRSLISSHLRYTSSLQHIYFKYDDANWPKYFDLPMKMQIRESVHHASHHINIYVIWSECGINFGWEKSLENTNRSPIKHRALDETWWFASLAGTVGCTVTRRDAGARNVYMKSWWIILQHV